MNRKDFYLIIQYYKAQPEKVHVFLKNNFIYITSFCHILTSNCVAYK